MQPKNMGELQPTGRSKLCTHADNLALNTDPPEQQAYMTFRPWEVVGLPMGVVARSTLTPRDKSFNYYSSEARFLIDTSQKKSACVCSTNLGFSVRSANRIRPKNGIPMPVYIHSF